MKKAFKNHIILVAFLSIFLNGFAFAQNFEDIKLNETFQNQPLKDFLIVLQEKYGLKVFYKKSWIEPFQITKTFKDTPLLQALNNIFYEHELTYKLFQDDGIIVFRKSMDVRQVYFWKILKINSVENVGFTLSDLKGKVEITIEGYTNQNEFFKTSKTIEIK